MNTTTIILIVAVVVVLPLLYFRFAPSKAGAWHVDPLTVTPDTRPRKYLLKSDQTYALPAEQLLQEFATVSLASPRTQMLEGDVSDLHITLIQRTKMMGYPDYISVRAIAVTDSTSKLAIYSRSRFGYSDLGVNKARVQAWVAALGQFKV